MRALALAGLLALSPAVLAQNWVGLLKNTPAERFDEEDLRLFMDTARKALAEGKDKETLAWQNPKTRARGEVTVVRRFPWKSHPCTELHLVNEAQGRSGESRLGLCQVDGKWRLLSPSQLKGQK